MMGGDFLGVNKEWVIIVEEDFWDDRIRWM